MKLQRLEARVLELIEVVRVGRTVEDDRVELKGEWPTDHAKTARQIAGHANSCGGEPILWIIGLDEKRQRVGTVSDVELANWWPQVSKWFEGDQPELSHLLVPGAPGERVAALQFETTRAPYVVKVPKGRDVDFEVPWRSGNRTRSARRVELLRSVVEQAQVPDLELVRGAVTLEYIDDRDSGEDGHVVRASFDLFISAAGEAILPQHRQTWGIRAIQGSSTLNQLDFDSVIVRKPFQNRGTPDLSAADRSRNIDVVEDSGLVVHRSGVLAIQASTRVDRLLVPDFEDVIPGFDLYIDLLVDRSDRSCRLVVPFRRGPAYPDYHPTTQVLASFEHAQDPAPGQSP